MKKIMTKLRSLWNYCRLHFTPRYLFHKYVCSDALQRRLFSFGCFLVIATAGFFTVSHWPDAKIPIVTTILGGGLLAYFSVFFIHPYLEQTGIVLGVSWGNAVTGKDLPKEEEQDVVDNSYYPYLVICNCTNKFLIINRIYWRRWFNVIIPLEIPFYASDQGEAFGPAYRGEFHLGMVGKAYGKFNSNKIPPGGILVISIWGNDIPGQTSTHYPARFAAEKVIEWKAILRPRQGLQYRLDKLKLLASFRSFRVDYNNGMSCRFSTRELKKALRLGMTFPAANVDAEKSDIAAT